MLSMGGSTREFFDQTTVCLQLDGIGSYIRTIANSTLYPRFAERPLTEALTDSPVVLIHGPRQSGKTTLAQVVCVPHLITRRGNAPIWRSPPLVRVESRQRDYSYLSLDDEVLRSSAETDPLGFVGDLPERVVLDEVQRVPSLFAALKIEVDRRRTPGRFVLTGSSNVLLIPRLSDSLAGRMAMVRLHPLAQYELAGPVFLGKSTLGAGGRPGFLGALFDEGFKSQRMRRLGRELSERIVAGGYPAALARPTGRRRAAWYRDFVDA